MFDVLRRGLRWAVPSNDKKIRRKYARHYDKLPIDEHLVLYETRDGKSIVDSPLALFVYLARSPKYQSLRHVWSINSNEDPEQIQMSIPADLRDQISFVIRDSSAYINALLTAHYLINNSTFGSYYTKRDGQVYINTWHGTPLKHMGFDTAFNKDSSKNVLRNFLMTDYLLSPNRHTTKIFTDGYKLSGLYSGEILESGYPRIDNTVNSDPSQVREQLIAQGISIDSSKRTLLYTPTWKGKNVNQATDDVEQIISEYQALVGRFDSEYNVLLKVHPFAFDMVRDDPRVKGHLISNYFDANILLSIVDLLITDYSSIFFDFLVTGKPIIFYAWDRDLYNAERGMYFPQSELPGPTAENLDQLIQTIADIDNIEPEFVTRYEEMKAKIVYDDDGHSTKRYVDYIFGHQPDQTMFKVIKPAESKIKLLVYPGGMKNNGITTSLMNLLNNIDYKRYDVTVLGNVPRNRQSRQNIENLNEHVRPMFRFGNSILTAHEELVDSRLTRNGLSHNKRNRYPKKAYQRETARLTGGAKFDVAIDFSGYSYFWARHILAAQAKKYVAFMHNDLDADSKREVNGKFPMYRGLHGIFTLYYQFDRLLSVSKMTRDVNLRKLEDYVTPNQMGFVTNTINIDDILTPIDNLEGSSEEENQLIVQRDSLRVDSPVSVKVFVTLNDINAKKSNNLTLTPESKITSFASATVQGKNYVKLSVDNKYVGWVTQEVLLPGRIHIYSAKNVRQMATVTRYVWSGIYPDLDESHDSNQVTARAIYLKGHYVRIDKTAETSDGRYAHIIYRGKVLGWMPSRSLARFHSLSILSPQRLYFMIREVNNAKIAPVELPQAVVSETRYFVVGKHITDDRVWSWPASTTNAEVRTTLSEFSHLAFFVDEIVTNVKGDKYARLTNRGDTLGYTLVQNLLEITQEEYQQALTNQAKHKAANLPEVDITRRLLPKFDSQYFNVVNMGRLSPEKNQVNLIRGFARFVQQEPKSRLYILGSGPLADELVSAIDDNEMKDHIFLLGHVDHPFNFLKKCDLFILPSLYEGQPMVLLEALTLGMRILVSNIPANIQVAGADERYGQLMQGTSPEAITEGLTKAKREDYTPSKFDYLQYNRDSIDAFYHEIQPVTDKLV